MATKPQEGQQQKQDQTHAVKKTLKAKKKNLKGLISLLFKIVLLMLPQIQVIE